MTDLRPVLLLDVDGVLNPFPETPEGFVEYDLFPGNEEPVRLSPGHGEWLRELARVYDLVWATGWGDHANRLLSPHFGLRELPVIPLPQLRFEPQDKVPAVDSYVGDRPAAWVDDIVTAEAVAWAQARSAPTLLVEVDPAVGLTRAAVDELFAWATALRQTRP